MHGRECRGPVLGCVDHRRLGNDIHFAKDEKDEGTAMARNELRPIIKLRSTAGTGYTYVTRKSRRNDPDRTVLRKYDPRVGRHVDFREER